MKKQKVQINFRTTVLSKLNQAQILAYYDKQRKGNAQLVKAQEFSMENGNDNRVIVSLFSEDGNEMYWLDTVNCEDQNEVNEKIVDILSNYENDSDYNGTGLVLKAGKTHYNLTKDNNGVVRNRETGELFAFGEQKGEINVAREHKLTKGEIKQLLKAMKQDERLQELWVTHLERPLNALERMMVRQIVREHSNGQAQIVASAYLNGRHYGVIYMRIAECYIVARKRELA